MGGWINERGHPDEPFLLPPQGSKGLIFHSSKGKENAHPDHVVADHEAEDIRSAHNVDGFLGVFEVKEEVVTKKASSMNDVDEE